MSSPAGWELSALHGSSVPKYPFITSANIPPSPQVLEGVNVQYLITKAMSEAVSAVSILNGNVLHKNFYRTIDTICNDLL